MNLRVAKLSVCVVPSKGMTRERNANEYHKAICKVVSCSTVANEKNSRVTT